MTDEEWAIFAPFLTTASSRGGRPPVNHRHRLDGILWICRTGAPWRDLPAAFGKWNSVWKQFRRVWGFPGRVSAARANCPAPIGYRAASPGAVIGVPACTAQNTYRVIIGR
jgi:transposase